MHIYKSLKLVVLVLFIATVAFFAGCDGGITPPITPNTYIITASAGPNGSISPSGNITVNQGSDKLFTITPDTGYQIYDVLVDESSVGAVSSYTFTNVTEDHTIYATFISEASGPFNNCICEDYPPFTYIDDNDNPVGFDIDCVNWIAKEMGFEVKHIPIPWPCYWDVIVTMFAAGYIDLVASGLTITEWRKESVDFTIPYWQTDQGETYGYAVTKGDEELKNILNEGLRRLMNSPKWDEFVAKWELQDWRMSLPGSTDQE